MTLISSFYAAKLYAVIVWISSYSLIFELKKYYIISYNGGKIGIIEHIKVKKKSNIRVLIKKKCIRL